MNGGIHRPASLGSSGSDGRLLLKLSDAEQICAMAADWRDAHAKHGGSLYLTPEWMLSLWEAHRFRKGVDFWCGYENGSLTAVFPLVRESISKLGIPLSRLSFLGNSYGQNHNELAGFPCSAEEVCVLFDGIADEPWDILALTSIPEGSASLGLIKSAGEVRGHRFYEEEYVSSPYLPLHATWEEFLASRSSNFRSDMRRKWSRASDAGLRVEEVRAGARVQTALEAILEIERRSWKHSEGTSIPAQDHAVRFYRAFLPRASERGWLRLYLVYHGSEAIAYDMGVVLGGKYYMLKTGFIDEFGKLSPGVFIRQHVIKALIQEGISEHDFLGEAEPYKMRWTNLVRKHSNLYVLNSRRARATAFFLARAGQRRLEAARLSIRNRLAST